jgi:hypothetical protein
MMLCDKLLVVQQKCNVMFSEECCLENRIILSRNGSGIFPLCRVGASKLFMARATPVIVGWFAGRTNRTHGKWYT